MKVTNRSAVSNKKREVLFFELVENSMIFIAHTFFDLFIQIGPICARAATNAFTRWDRHTNTEFEYDTTSDASVYAAFASHSVLCTVVVVLLVRTVADCPVTSGESPDDILQSAGSSALHIDLKVRGALCADFTFKYNVTDDVRAGYAHPNSILQEGEGLIVGVVGGAAKVTTPALFAGSVKVVVERRAHVGVGVEVTNDGFDERVELFISDEFVALVVDVGGGWSEGHGVDLNTWRGLPVAS